MSMSDHERSLLVTGTLDTSGVGGSPYANLDQVSLAFDAEPAVVFTLGDADPVAIPVEELLVDGKLPFAEFDLAKAAESSPSGETEADQKPEAPEAKTEPEAETEPVAAPAPAPAPARKRTTKKTQASAPVES
jgi:hypothetical protein